MGSSSGKKDSAREEKRKQRQDILARQIIKATRAKAQKRAIVEGMIRAKSPAQIADGLGLTEATVRRLQREVVKEFNDNYTKDVNFWLEKLVARYEMLWRAVEREVEEESPGYIKLANEILKNLSELVGATAAARQRDKALALNQKRVDAEIGLNAIDQYRKLLSQTKPTVEYPVDHSPLALPSGDESDEDDEATEIYED